MGQVNDRRNQVVGVGQGQPGVLGVGDRVQADFQGRAELLHRDVDRQVVGVEDRLQDEEVELVRLGDELDKPVEELPVLDKRLRAAAA